MLRGSSLSDLSAAGILSLSSYCQQIILMILSPDSPAKYRYRRNAAAEFRRASSLTHKANTMRAFFWLFLLITFLLPAPVDAADRLVIITPHWEGIRYEFADGFEVFYQRETGREVAIEWMDVGGSSEVLRFIKSEFKNKPEGIDVDLLFGGGSDPYLELSRVDLLESYVLPDSIMSRLPESVGGYPLYDDDFKWYGATIAGFGIVYNKHVLNILDLPEPSTWDDLTQPGKFTWIGSADPRKSGSAHMPFEIILQAYGWERGWQIITALGANTRNFANAGSQVPKDVTTGEVAYGMSIDFYAWAQINEVGADMIGFSLPDNLTIVNPDAIAMLKGSPNPEVARSFLRFVFSPYGQRLWMMNVGTPGGPTKFQLNRFSVLPDLYDSVDPKNTSVTFNPFEWSSNFVYDAEKGSARWGILNDLIGTFIIDAHQQLRAAWKKAIESETTNEILPALAVMPVTEEEASVLGREKWRDQTYRNSTLLEWGRLANKKYGGNADQLPMTDKIVLLGSLIFGCVMTGYLWRLNRKGAK